MNEMNDNIMMYLLMTVCILSCALVCQSARLKSEDLPRARLIRDEVDANEIQAQDACF